jgi:hypothetical protein
VTSHMLPAALYNHAEHTACTRQVERMTLIYSTCGRVHEDSWRSARKDDGDVHTKTTWVISESARMHAQDVYITRVAWVMRCEALHTYAYKPDPRLGETR